MEERVVILRDTYCRLDDYRIIYAALNLGVSVINIDDLVLSPTESFPGRVVINRAQSSRVRKTLTQIAEAKGCRVINPTRILQYSGNKFLLYVRAHELGINTPQTALPFYTLRNPDKKVYERQLIERLAEKITRIVEGHPHIIKPINGSHGRGVRRIENKDELIETLLVRTAFDETIYQRLYSGKWEVRVVTLKMPHREARTLTMIAKYGENIRNLAVSGVPINLPYSKKLAELDCRLVESLVRDGGYLLTGNDWAPLEIDENLEIDVGELRKKYEKIRQIRKRLRLAYKKFIDLKIGGEEEIIELEEKEEKLCKEYRENITHQKISEAISSEIEERDFVIMDLNDNQDFPNVRGIARTKLEENYLELAETIKRYE